MACKSQENPYLLRGLMMKMICEYICVSMQVDHNVYIYIYKHLDISAYVRVSIQCICVLLVWMYVCEGSVYILCLDSW